MSRRTVLAASLLYFVAMAVLCAGLWWVGQQLWPAGLAGLGGISR